jgi:hypothetical protein
LFLPGAASRFVRRKAPVDPDVSILKKKVSAKKIASICRRTRAAFELQDFGTARWQLFAHATSSWRRPKAYQARRIGLQ